MPRENRARLAPDLVGGRSSDPAPAPHPNEAVPPKQRSVSGRRRAAKKRAGKPAEPAEQELGNAESLAEAVFHRKGAATAASFRPWYWRY